MQSHNPPRICPDAQTQVTSSNPTSGKKRPAKRPKAKSQASLRSSVIQQSFSGTEDDDVLAGFDESRGQGFGRCGGRVLSSELEQQVCDLLSNSGLTHSHSPRHFEVPVTDDLVGAYAPLIVLRGRGRGGKTVVIECAEDVDEIILQKIVAFRERFGNEFYIIFIAPEDVLDEVPLSAYDESSVTTDLGTLINRLAD